MIRQTYSVPIHSNSIIQTKITLIYNQQKNVSKISNAKNQNIIPISNHMLNNVHNPEKAIQIKSKQQIHQYNKSHNFIQQLRSTVQTKKLSPKQFASVIQSSQKNNNNFNNEYLNYNNKSHQSFSDRNVIGLNKLVQKQKKSILIQESKNFLTNQKSNILQNNKKSQLNQFNSDINKPDFNTKIITSFKTCQYEQINNDKNIYVKNVYSPQFQTSKKINFPFDYKSQINYNKRSAINETVNNKDDLNNAQKDRISQPNLNLYWLQIKKQEEKLKLLSLKSSLDKSDKSKASSKKHIKSIELQDAKKIIQDPYQFLSPQSRKLANATSLKTLRYKNEKKQDQNCSRKYSDRIKDIFQYNKRQKRVGSPQLNRLYYNTKRIQKNLIQKSKQIKQNDTQFKQKIDNIKSSIKSLLSKKNNQQQDYFEQDNAQFKKKSLFMPSDSKKYEKDKSKVVQNNNNDIFRKNFNCKSQIYLKNNQNNFKAINRKRNLLSPQLISKTNKSTHFEQQISKKSFTKISNLSQSKVKSKVEKVILQFIFSLKENTQSVQFLIIDKLADNVFIVIHTITNSIYCLKQLPLNKENKNSVINQFKNLMILNNPNILKIYGIFKLSNNCKEKKNINKVYLLTQYLQDKTLKQENIKFFQKLNKNKQFDHLRNQDSLKYENAQKCKRIFYFLQQIIKSLKVIHNHNIIHRDIKPLNIFKSNKIYKIGDFGSSTNNFSQQHIGTLDYASPQMLLKQAYDKKIDIWSIGCIIYQMYVGFPPFYDYDRQKTFQNIVRVKYNSNLIKDKDLSNLIENMLQRNPQNRIKIEQILQHKFITKYKKLIQS